MASATGLPEDHCGRAVADGAADHAQSPDKRNPLSNELRTELFHALENGDQDESVRVFIIRGAGPCFSAGYDLASDVRKNQPYYSAGGLGSWPRHVVEGFFKSGIWPSQ